MKLLSELTKGKLLGHPIHAMLVHFPLALFPISLIFDVISLVKSDSLLAMVSFYTMGCGTIGAYLAACFGMIDFIHLPNEKTIWRKALIHAGINVLVVFSYTILIVLRLKKYPNLEIPSMIEILSIGLLNILLIISAHFGGDLVYRHKIGVIKKEEI